MLVTQSRVHLATVAARLLCPWDSPGKSTGVAMPSSRGSSQPRAQTQVSCIACRFFIIWVTRECKSKLRRGVRKYSNFILLHVAVQFSQHRLLKRLYFLHCIFLPPLSKITYIQWNITQPNRGMTSHHQNGHHQKNLQTINAGEGVEKREWVRGRSTLLVGM